MCACVVQGVARLHWNREEQGAPNVPSPHQVPNKTLLSSSAASPSGWFPGVSLKSSIVSLQALSSPVQHMLGHLAPSVGLGF